MSAANEKDNERAQRGIRILQNLAKTKGLKGYCHGCGEEGDYGSRHGLCGGYFTDDEPTYGLFQRDELRGLREIQPQHAPASLGFVTVQQTIDTNKIKTQEEREAVLSKFLATLGRQDCIAVEVVGSGIQTIESVGELVEWLDRVDKK